MRRVSTICRLPGLLSACLLLIASLAAPARADGPAASAWAGMPEAQLRLIAARTGVDGPAARVGLEIRLAEGWKTYWRNPGESGAPPRLDWSGSDNVDAVEVLWPAPRRFTAFGFDSFGYGGTLVLPLDVHLQRPDQPVSLRLAAAVLICAEICVPVEAQLDLALPAGAATPSPHAATIARFADQVPKQGMAAPFRIVSAHTQGTAGEQSLLVEVEATVPFQAPDLMVEGPMPFGFGRPEVELNADGRRARLRLPVYAGAGKPLLTAGTLRFTLVDGSRAAEAVLDLSTRG